MAYASSYVGRLNFSACLTDIIETMNLTKAYAGTVGTGFLACYGVGQLINGFISEKTNPKHMITIGLVGSSLANIIIGINKSSVLLLILWCANGYFNSMHWSSVIKCFSEYMIPERRKKAALHISSTIPAGTIFSYLISSVLLKFFSWQANFILIGVFLFGVAIVWNFGMNKISDYILQAKTVIKSQSLDSEKSMVSKDTISFGKLLISSGLMFVVVGILFNGILKDGVTQWVPNFITENFSVDSSFASFSSILLPIVNLSGAFLAVRINEKKIFNEVKTSALMFIVSAVSLMFLYFLGKYSLILSVFLIAISTSSMLGANTLFLSFIPLKFSAIGKSASLTGFLNACSYLASALSMVSIGLIAQTKGWGMTVLSWVVVAIAGLLVCVLGSSIWKEKRNLYSGER